MPGSMHGLGMASIVGPEGLVLWVSAVMAMKLTGAIAPKFCGGVSSSGLATGDGAHASGVRVRVRHPWRTAGHRP